MVTNFLKNAFQFIIPPEKRINRSRYLVILVLCGVLTYIRELYIPLFQSSKLSYVAAATILAHIVINIIAIIKRAHDINLSGAWIALYLLGAMAIVVLPETSDYYNSLRNITFISICCIIISFLLLIIPGTKGANKFGEQPPKSSVLVRIIMTITLLAPVVYILWLVLIFGAMYYGSGK